MSHGNGLRPDMVYVITYLPDIGSKFATKILAVPAVDNFRLLEVPNMELPASVWTSYPADFIARFLTDGSFARNEH